VHLPCLFFDHYSTLVSGDWSILSVFAVYFFQCLPYCLQDSLLYKSFSITVQPVPRRVPKVSELISVD